MSVGLGWEGVINEELTDSLIEKQTETSSASASSKEKGNLFGPRNSENFWVIPHLYVSFNKRPAKNQW